VTLLAVRSRAPNGRALELLRRLPDDAGVQAVWRVLTSTSR
jgi:hypothetical protein